MRTKSGSLLILLFTAYLANAQVAINSTGANPDNSAMLDVTSTTKGMLIPRMTTAERTAIASPAAGLLVYDNTLSLFYYYTGSAWSPIATPGSNWSTNGNSGTVSGTNFIGTTNNQHLDIRTNNIVHTRIRVNGQIEVLNTGSSTYLGENAGLNDDLTNRRNVGIGYNALASVVSGSNNTGAGYEALRNAIGNYNTGVGYQALTSTTTGFYNTAFGQSALLNNTTGGWNVAVGAQAMTGSNTGTYNLAVGYNSLPENTSGVNNVGIGLNAMTGNTTGGNNIGIGSSALTTNTTGSNNIAIGNLADVSSANLTNATAIGYNAKVAQSNSLVLGGTGTDAVSVGIGTTTPLSTLDVNGAIGIKVKSAQAAGTNNPDNTATIWLYSSGTGTITLPAANTCTNRMYIIVNQTGATRNISSYRNLAGAAQTTLATATSITILSDGANWLQTL
jgi:trimeric autotransporter adhesin